MAPFRWPKVDQDIALSGCTRSLSAGTQNGKRQTSTSRLPFAVNVMLNLSIVGLPQGIIIVILSATSITIFLIALATHKFNNTNVYI